MSPKKKKGLIIPELTAEIDGKLEVLSQDPTYILKSQKKLFKQVDNPEHLYNWWLEHPDFQKQVITNPKSRKKIYNIAKLGSMRVSETWGYLIHNYTDIMKNLDSRLILDIGYKVEPSNTSLRNEHKSIGKRFVAPNPAKLPYRLAEILYEAKDNRWHKIEQAIFIHMMLVGLQPLNEGNKRTARLIQNKILHENNYPAAVIPPGERQHYLTILEDALIGTKMYGDKERHNPAAFYPFFTYIAGKINTQLDNNLKHLDLK